MIEKTVALSVVQQKAITIKDFIHKEGIVKQLEAALPRFLNADRFLRTIYSALLQNPKLLDCTQDSLLSSMIQAAQLGLEPVLGKAALIPYGTEMQFQPMFRGLIDLAMRSDKIDKITAHTVYDKDSFAIDYGTSEKLTHKPFLDGDRGNIRGSYTVWYYKDGGTTHSYMSISDIYKIRDRSQAWKAFLKFKKTCPWNTDESEMCKKTVIKRHSKLQPCSVEFEQAVEYDNALEAGVSIVSNIKELPATKAELLTEKIKADPTPAQDLKTKLDAGDKEVEGYKPINEEVQSTGGAQTKGHMDAVRSKSTGTQADVEEVRKEAISMNAAKELDSYLAGSREEEPEPSPIEQGESKGVLPDGVDPIEWLTACRPSTSIANAKAALKVFEEQESEINMLADRKLRDRLEAKHQKTKDYIFDKDNPPISKGQQAPGITPERLEFEEMMRAYMGRDEQEKKTRYQDKLDDLGFLSIADVKGSDEAVVLGFMAEEFGE